MAYWKPSAAKICRPMVIVVSGDIQPDAQDRVKKNSAPLAFIKKDRWMPKKARSVLA